MTGPHRRWRRLRSRVEGREAGFTLAELLVGITMSAMIGTVIAAATTNGLHRERQIQDRNTSAAQARTALQRVDREIRGATYPVSYASTTKLVLVDSQASVTRTMTYQVLTSGGVTSLVVDETDVTASGTTVIPRQTVVTRLVQTSTYPVFSASAVPGYTSTDPTVDTSLCTIGSTSTYAQDCVGTITVHLRVQPASLSQPLDMSDNGTALRNAT